MAKVLFSAAVGLDADFDQRLLAFYEEIAELIERSLEQGEEAFPAHPGPVFGALHNGAGGLAVLALHAVDGSSARSI